MTDLNKTAAAGAKRGRRISEGGKLPWRSPSPSSAAIGPPVQVRPASLRGITTDLVIKKCQVEYLHVTRYTKYERIFDSFEIQVDVQPPVLSTCPLHTKSGCGKERRILIGPWGSAKAAPVRNYLEGHWPFAGGLSAVNAIGTQLRDPINSGLTRWRMAVS